MKHPDLMRVAERLDQAVARGDERLAKQRDSGDANAVTAAAYAQAEHAALVIVAYTRHKATQLEDTGLLCVPACPLSAEKQAALLPDGLDWPEGFPTGPLADANERKVAARAIAAHLQEERDRALNEFRCDRTATELAQGQVSAFQSVLKAESQEARIDTFHDLPPEMRQAPPRRTPPPPPRRQ